MGKSTTNYHTSNGAADEQEHNTPEPVVEYEQKLDLSQVEFLSEEEAAARGMVAEGADAAPEPPEEPRDWTNFIEPAIGHLVRKHLKDGHTPVRVEVVGNGPDMYHHTRCSCTVVTGSEKNRVLFSHGVWIDLNTVRATVPEGRQTVHTTGYVR